MNTKIQGFIRCINTITVRVHFMEFNDECELNE